MVDMELYRRLRDYNESLLERQPSLPSWLHIFAAQEPPAYWQVLADLLGSMEPSPRHCVEIGAGAGDVAVLLAQHALASVVAVERDPQLARVCAAKLAAFGCRQARVVQGSYPLQLPDPPDLLVMVNCAFPEGARSPQAYLKRLRRWLAWNGVPQRFLLEVLDPGEAPPEFSRHVQVSESQMRSAFPRSRILGYPTYRLPRNRCSKTLYLIEGDGA